MSYAVHIERTAVLSVDAIECVIEMAGFGCTYWAIEADWSRSEQTWTLRHHTNPDDPDSPVRVDVLTYAAIAAAMGRIYSGTVPGVGDATEADVRAELDDPTSEGAEVDADDGDQIVQVAIFGEVIYG